MAKKKCKCPPPGAPDWIVTYGDMVTLLLCFFVLIVSFSEIKKDGEYQAVVKEISKAFGMQGGGGKMDTRDDPALSFIKKLEAMAAKSQRFDNRSSTTDPGMQGDDPMVRSIREGQRFAVGGLITFEPGYADLTDRAREQLLDVAELIRGKNNKIFIQGHAAAGEELKLLDPDSRYLDLWDLSAARAKAVLKFLVSDQVGLKRERFRLQGNAATEPLIQREYTEADVLPNRRVVVEVSELLVADVTAAQSGGR